MAKSRARSVSQTSKPAPPPWRNLSRRALIAAALLTFLVVGMALALPTASAQQQTALTKPTNVAATVSGNNLTLTWTDGQGAAGHMVMLFTSDFIGDPVVVPNATSPHTFNAVADGSYIAVVVAFDANADYLYQISDLIVLDNRDRAPGAMPRNFKVAFIGDQGWGDNASAVLRLIKEEGTDMVLHSGDFAYRERYGDGPDLWDQQINDTLGEDFPYFASIGNHDVLAWDGYHRKLQERLARISGAQCTGDLGVNSFCTYKGLFFLLSGVGTTDSGRASYIKEALASEEANASLWKVCSWHRNQRLMQVGGKGDSVGWEPYDECRKADAIIATADEHSYSRTRLMDGFENLSIASMSDVLHLDGGRSFAFVSGLGGHSIRDQDDRLADQPWWASVYTSAQDANYGTLFCVLNHEGVANRGYCYFKDIDGVIADAFGVIVGPAQDVDYDYTIELPLENWSRLERGKPASANRLKALPWIADGVDYTERNAAEKLIEAALWWPDTFDALLQAPWTQDTITRDEATVIEHIYRITRAYRPGDAATQLKVSEAAAALLDMPFLETVESADAMAVWELGKIARRNSDDFLNVMASPKVRDGITDQEAKVVAVINSAYRYRPASLPVLLGGLDGTGSVHLEEETIDLTHSGEVQLTIIRVQNRDTDTMEYLQSAVRNVENFMGEPLPTNYVALYIDDATAGGGGYHAGTHINIVLSHDDVNHPDRARTPKHLAHEVGHYYWKGESNRWWLSEGAADLVSFVSEHVRVERPLEPDRPPCPYFDTIRQLESANPALDSRENSCNYSLGQRLFLDLYETLGDADFRSGFRNLYLTAERGRPGRLAGARADDRQGIWHVVAAFKANLSDAAAAKVDQVILRRYGTNATYELGTHAGDRAELIKLYHAAGGPDWTNNANWLSDDHISKWHGVTTDDDGRVTRLALSGNGLSGAIPSGLGNLANLQRLYLNRNQLTGPIPHQLGNLSRLEILDLSFNQLTGPIPHQLGNLSNLQRLFLGDNNLNNNPGLTGEIPHQLGSLTKLVWLYLDDNQLTGQIPHQLGNLSNLRGLYLHDNQLTGPIPHQLGNLSNLERLTLNDNDLTAGPVPTWLSNLTNLEQLNLGDTARTGEIPASLGGLSKLTFLRLDRNRLDGTIPSQLGNLTNLTYLNLRGNQLDGAIPSELARLTNLTHLYLYDNELTGSIPTWLGSLTNLERLELYDNELTGPIPSQLGNLANLQRLYLNNNQLTGMIPAELGNLANLEHIYLAGNEGLTGCVPAALRDVADNDFDNLGLEFCGQ